MIAEKAAGIVGKRDAVFVASGTEAIRLALARSDVRGVGIPAWSCRRIVEGVLSAGASPVIVDIEEESLQVCPQAVKELYSANAIDAVIVPHMFGIQADVSEVRRLCPHLVIIEDCSQAIGLPAAGAQADMVVYSTGRSKWLPVGYGGVLAYDLSSAPFSTFRDDGYSELLAPLLADIERRKSIRSTVAQELEAAGLDLIGSDRPNVWLRAMYKTHRATRSPCDLLHQVLGASDCAVAERLAGRVDWVSIWVPEAPK